jgi:hypothetical protein
MNQCTQQRRTLMRLMYTFSSSISTQSSRTLASTPNTTLHLDEAHVHHQQQPPADVMAVHTLPFAVEGSEYIQHRAAPPPRTLMRRMYTISSSASATTPMLSR